MVQRNIKKRYELRVFYFDSKFFSMVMFSQNEHQTSIDFRRYDFTNPTRWVPYKLPFQIEEKLDKLMRTLHLNSGSIDLIYGADLEYYFLEVNPVGQYAMVSDACNYYLDKLICDFLIKQNERQQQF
ncbi:MAG: hypothetical protein IPJ20_20805 [Flammeovirgaceae bacterium]|nr:hypothetical protein [Flammeovirgaceae bacterium]